MYLPDGFLLVFVCGLLVISYGFTNERSRVIVMVIHVKDIQALYILESTTEGREENQRVMFQTNL